MPRQDTMARSPTSPLVGRRFEVDRLIGRGGMGEVFAARHVLTGRHVALKVIRADGANAGRTNRFVREARIAGALRHPNIVEVLDAFEDEGGAAVLVMELLVGETLAAHRAREGTLSLEAAATILVPVARALVAAHRAGVVHRDLKPDNIFLATGEDGRRCPKVLDFGIAKVLDWTQLAGELEGQTTNTGALVGTPHYMAFEQAMSEKDVDCRADIWSLGVILFEALAGRRPIAFETLGQMYTAFLQGSIASAREALPELPGAVAETLDRCLTIDRSDRLAELAPFIDALAPYERCDGSTVTRTLAPAVRHVPAPGSPARTRVSLRAVATGATAFAATAAVVVSAVAFGHGQVSTVVSRNPPSATRVEASAVGEVALPRGDAGVESAPPAPAEARSEPRERDATQSGARPSSTVTGFSGPSPRPSAPATPPVASVAATASSKAMASGSLRPAVKKGILDTLPY